jgi:hypothetical protein
MTDMAHLSVGFGVGVHLHQSFCHIVISVQYKIPVERNGMMSATDVMPRAKLKMSISLPARAVALHLCLAF